MNSPPTPPATLASGRWAVGLVGGGWELAEIAPHFTGAIRVSQDADGWELTAERFDEANDARTVRTLAGEMLALVNGIARIRLDAPDPISLGNVRRYRDGRARDVWVFPETIRLKVRVGTPTVMVNSVVSTMRSWEPDIELAVRDVRVQAVFAFLATMPTWHSLYAALDTVLKDPRTGRRSGVKRWGGVSEAQLKLFTKTANSFSAVGVQARHGPGAAPALRPVDLAVADELVGHIVERWLDELRRWGADAG